MSVKNDLENVDIGTAFELEVSALSESIPNEGFRKDKLREMKCLLMVSKRTKEKNWNITLFSVRFVSTSL